MRNSTENYVLFSGLDEFLPKKFMMCGLCIQHKLTELRHWHFQMLQYSHQSNSNKWCISLTEKKPSNIKFSSRIFTIHFCYAIRIAYTLKRQHLLCIIFLTFSPNHSNLCIVCVYCELWNIQQNRSYILIFEMAVIIWVWNSVSLILILSLYRILYNRYIRRLK